MFTEIKQIECVGIKGFSSFNPSLHWKDGVWRCLVRHADYSIDELHRYHTAKNHGVIRCRSSMLELDESFRVVREIEIKDLPTPYLLYPSDEHGWFDGRLFHMDESFWIVACQKEGHPKQRHEQILLRLGSNYEVNHQSRIQGPWSEWTQKNWVPIEGNGLLIQDIDRGTVIDSHQSSMALSDHWEHSGLRGSSQLIKVENRWIGIAHDMTMSRPSGRKKYRHCFYEMDIRGKKIAQGPWLAFGKSDIEYCAGLAWDGVRLVASFGIMDRTAHLATMDLDLVFAGLWKVV